jgi:hypothetical protein
MGPDGHHRPTDESVTHLVPLFRIRSISSDENAALANAPRVSCKQSDLSRSVVQRPIAALPNARSESTQLHIHSTEVPEPHPRRLVAYDEPK